MKTYLAFVFVLLFQSLHAYTDPGTGSMIWQLLMASGFGLLFYVRSFFRWVFSLGSKQAVDKK